jgi:hypothetical protein
MAHERGLQLVASFAESQQGVGSEKSSEGEAERRGECPVTSEECVPPGDAAEHHGSNVEDALESPSRAPRVRITFVARRRHEWATQCEEMECHGEREGSLNV